MSNFINLNRILQPNSDTGTPQDPIDENLLYRLFGTLEGQSNKRPTSMKVILIEIFDYVGTFKIEENQAGTTTFLNSFNHKSES